MRVNWVVSSTYQLDPTLDPEKLKLIGPIWGSWRTWRSCSTDNVICYDFAKSRELIDRAFQAVCNFYVPRKYYQDLGRPVGLKLYDGEFAHDIDFPEDIISLHLAAGSSDIVLLLGFDFGKIATPADRYQSHQIQHQHGLMRSAISSSDMVQWVLVDHPMELDKSYQNIANLARDTMENVLKLLI